MAFLIFIGRFFALPAVYIKYLFKNVSGPQRLRLVLEELGGVYMKLGQILAMRFDIMPIKYAEALLDLLDDAKKIDNEKMFAIFERETGKKVGEVFNKIDDTPLGTASFAQVYKATWGDNEVVLKIQKPESEKFIKADLAFLKLIAPVAGLFASLKSVPPKEILAQLKEWLDDELDYTIEAQNNQILYDHAKRHKLENVVIPKIYPALATKKFLVQEFLAGSQVKRILVYLDTRPDDLKKILEERNIDLLKSANAFIYDLMRQYFIDGFFHADPHPANLMIFPDSRIGFIDFGIIGRSNYDNIGLLRFIKASTELDFRESAEGLADFLNQRVMREYGEMIEGDPQMQKIYETTLNFVTRRLAEDIAPILKDWHFFTGKKDTSISERSSARAFLKIAKAIEKYGLRFPPDVIGFLRSLLIVDMVCLKLSDDFDMVKAARVFFDRHTVEEVAVQAPQHQKETAQLNELQSLHIAEIAPEKEGAIATAAGERLYAAKEKMMGLITALAEKHPELYNELREVS